MTKSASIGASTIELLRTRDQIYLTEKYKEVYPMVESFILKNSGSKDDAQDIVQDAFFILYTKIDTNDFELSSKLSTYVFGVARNLWLKKLTAKKIDVGDYENETKFSGLEEIETEKFFLIKKLENALELLGEPCKTIIVQFYYFKKSMKDIATQLHYTNAENAKNQKYKCFNRLKKLATEK